jgi:hypothetical protein
MHGVIVNLDWLLEVYLKRNLSLNRTFNYTIIKINRQKNDIVIVL